MTGNLLQARTSLNSRNKIGTFLTSLAVLLTMFASCSKAPDERPFTLSYEFRINGIPEGSSTLDIYLPIPPQTDVQVISDFRVSSVTPESVVVDSVYGNQMLRFLIEGDIPDAYHASIEFDITRLEQRESNLKSELSDRERGLYLKANQMVPIDGPMASEAANLILANFDDPEEVSDYAKAEALYWHLIATMTYDKSGSGWGKGDAEWACNSRRGNCTDIHSVFIGMARSLGIPARFTIGFPIPNDAPSGRVPGYHCWAEFFTAERGWVAADISEAIKDPTRREYYFGSLDKNRVSFSFGRDIELPNGKTLNYFVYPVVFVDGELFEGVDQRFQYDALTSM